MKTLWHDLKYAVRVMLKQPGFTLVAVVTLALGIGANTAIFTVVDAALLRSLPYRDPERLVHLWEAKQNRDFDRREASYPDFLDWRAQTTEVFEGVAGYVNRGYTLTGEGGPERVMGAAVTANFFDLLGVRPAHGRAFREGEDEPGAAAVAVLGHGLWQRRFGGDPKVVGREVTLNGESYTVVGVLPADFQFARVGSTDLWTGLRPTPNFATPRYMHWLNVVARLRPGVTMEAARARLDAVGRVIAAADPGAHKGTALVAVPLHEEVVGQVRPVLLAMLAAVSLVLLIACANVANLLLARGAARRKEVAIRTALGASRWRLVRQLLTESVLLAGVGGALGLVVALWGVDLLVAAIPEAQLLQMPYLRGLSLDPGLLLFTAALSLATGVLFGLMPALDASRADLQEAMKEGRRASGTKRSGRLRAALVVSEVAVALVLLVGAGLLVKSLLRMLSVDPGFRVENLLTMRVNLTPQRFAGDTDGSQRAAFFEELLRRAGNLPGVEGAAAVSNLPLSGDGGTGTPSVVGREEPAGGWSEAHLRVVSPNYFDVMGVRVQAGRGFTERDRVGTSPVILVNRTFAERNFGGEDPTGQRVTFRFTQGQPPFEIVGVVGDEKIKSLDAQTTPVIYFPMLQGPDSSAALVVRTASDPEAMAGALRGELRALDPDAPLFGVRTMERVISDAPATFMRRYPAYLIGVFAAVALILASVGIYGVISYAVTQRTHELAIRAALGARRADLLRLVLRQGLALALGGVAAGILGALALTRLLSSLLYGVSATDPSVYAGVSLLLLAVVLVACLVPARRATKVDPMEALRYE
ncbi:MAG TPA: ABC transporter permease [Pyrinomonadaceae bacterium]|nr:ABC transporter permease [Pyrinomonadaceae bacterium]